MTMPKLPFKAIGLWLLDFAKMPSRVADLAKAKETESDPREICRSCGKGRVANLKPVAGSRGDTQGRCEACACRHILDPKGKLKEVLGVHSPTPD